MSPFAWLPATPSTGYPRSRVSAELCPHFPCEVPSMPSLRTCFLVLTLCAVPVQAQTANRFLDRSRSDWLKDIEDKSIPVRRSAAFALGKIGDERDLRVLLDLA